MASLSDFEKLLKDYMVARIREKYPSIALGDGTPMSDLFINPMIEVLKPFIEEAGRQDLNQNLDNASIMSPEDLDEIGLGNYFISRSNGSYAKGTVYIPFKNIPTGYGIDIPKGAIVSRSASLRYSVDTTTSVAASDLVQYYNISTYTYDIPVSVTSEKVGEEYNANPNEINRLDTPIPYATKQVYHPTVISGGSGEESNTSYAARIKNWYMSRNLGTDDGFKEYVKSGFPAVEDARVVGFNHPLMIRDLFSTTSGDIHVGGKVDIYVKGATYADYTQTYKVRTNVFYTDFNPVVAGSVTVSNITNTSSPVTFTPTITTQSYVTITGGASSNDRLRIAYTYTDTSTGKTYDVEQDVFYMSTKVILKKSPVDTITKVINKTQVGQTTNTGATFDTTIPSTQYLFTLPAASTKGSTQEGAIFELTYPSGSRSVQKPDSSYYPYYSNEDEIEVTYRYNSLVSSIQADFDTSKRRIITTDVLVKAATPVYVYNKLEVKIRPGKILGAVEKNLLKAAVQDYVNTKNFTSSLYVSDMVSHIYQNSTIKEFLEYIKFPPVFYRLGTKESDYRSDTVEFPIHNSVVSLNDVEYPVLYLFDAVAIS